jgi:regulator of replication initiation timing
VAPDRACYPKSLSYAAGMKPQTHICSYLIFAAIFAVAAAFSQSFTPSPAVSPNPQELQRQVQQLKQENQQLKQENQRLRELLSQGNTNTRTAPVTQPARTYAPETAAASGGSDQKALTHWLTTSSNKRHNSNCRWFKNSKGRPCRADEGIPCKICGG